ncbi:MAG: hypothetical protein ACRDHZ_10635 [Ktedonobacteraceae bacterium]
MGLDAFTTNCEAVAAQFLIQLDGLDLEIVQTLPRYKYAVRDLRAGDQAREIVARCLPDTWSLYEQRFYHAAKTVDLLIVRNHNAASPIPVLSLADGRYYKAGTIPANARSNATRRTKHEQRLLVSLLALGMEAGDQALANMSEKSRRRYRSMLNGCLKPHRGRARSL